MAGTVTFTFTKIEKPYDVNGIIKLEIAWACDSGASTITTATMTTADYIKYLKGRYCVLGVTDPGSTAPTAAYDIEILDEYSCDIFGGTLHDRSATATEQAFPLLTAGYWNKRLITSVLSFALSNNSVNAATGQCILYFE